MRTFEYSGSSGGSLLAHSTVVAVASAPQRQVVRRALSSARVAKISTRRTRIRRTGFKLFSRPAHANVEEEGALAEEEEADMEKDAAAQPEKKKPSGWKSFAIGAISGAAAGLTVDVVLFPLDTIKTRLQARDFAGLVKGAGSMYSGLPAVVAAAAPCAATFFGTYDATKNLLADKAPAYLGQVAAAALGTVFAACIRTPSEVVKQGVQAGLYKTGREAAGAILKSRGIRGLYAGYGSLILREIPFDCIQFPMYEQLKTLGSRAAGGRQLHGHEITAVGMVAGAISAGLTTPLDVVKTRLMTQRIGDARQYTGIADAFSRIVKEEGPRALFRGLAPRMTMIGFGGAIFFTTFETVKRAVEPKIVGEGKEEAAGEAAPELPAEAAGADEGAEGKLKAAPAASDKKQ